MKPRRKRPAVSREAAEEAVRTLLQWAGEDPAREGLLDTPKRVVDAYGDWFSGYLVDPAAYLHAAVLAADRGEVLLPWNFAG